MVQEALWLRLHTDRNKMTHEHIKTREEALCKSVNLFRRLDYSRSPKRRENSFSCPALSCKVPASDHMTNVGGRVRCLDA